MMVKLLELRDEGTFIPLLCVDMNPGDLEPYVVGTATVPRFSDSKESYEARRYLLRRCGYPCDGRPNIAITHLRCGGDGCSNDPYHWNGRTFPVALKLSRRFGEEVRRCIKVNWTTFDNNRRKAR